MVRGQWANLARMPGLHPYSFSKDILGFLMTTESLVQNQQLLKVTGCDEGSVSQLYITNV